MHHEDAAMFPTTLTMEQKRAMPVTALPHRNFSPRTIHILKSCALLIVSVGVWPDGQAAVAAAGKVAAAPSKGKALDPALIPSHDSESKELPLCDYIKIHANALPGNTCAFGRTTRQTELCVVPRSYCATVEPAESLAAAPPTQEGHAAQSTDGGSIQQLACWDKGTDWTKIGEYAAQLERTLPVASTPACHCWAVGEAMVAPCDYQDAQHSNFSSPTASSTNHFHGYSAALPAVDGLADFGLTAAGGRLRQEPGHLVSRYQTGEGTFRRLAIGELTRGRESISAGVAAVAQGGPCHKSCASCLKPGRDQCRSCINQLPYPYVPPKEATLPALGSSDPTSNDIRGLQDATVHYHALVAAHRDGSGYCIPLAFGEDIPADADGYCFATNSSCSGTDGGSSWWTGIDLWNSRRGGHCHSTCSVCRADCCRRKPDNCLACKGRLAFHQTYRDGTGRCLDLVQPDIEQQAGSWEWEDLTAVLREGEDKTGPTEGEANAFSTFLQSIIHATSSIGPGENGEGTSRGRAFTKRNGVRKGTSFLQRHSICESLPQRVRDMPIRAWSQLMFVHADNNLEESALLDLDEMLHPWRGEVVRRHARAASHGRGTPPLPVGGSSLPVPNAHEALEDLYLVVLIDRSNQATTTDMGTVHACPQLEYSSIGQGARQLPGTSEVQLNSQMAFELLRIHLQDGRREWLLLRALGEVDMNDPEVLQTAVTRFLDMFPSRHYAVVLWNHGSAWAGFGDDESNPNNQPMSIQDIATGLRNGISGSKLGKVDRSFRLSLLGFDACLMGSYDVVEALAPLAHFFIASEENEPGHGWNYRSMDPTTLARKPPPLYRTATAFEYGTRFVSSYGLHPPSSNALTLALIEVRAFNEFKQKFEDLLESLYSCGGSNITRRVRRALSQTFSIRGCRLLGLCSCYDLSDFLANLLQQFASDESEIGRISLQSYEDEDEAPGSFRDRAVMRPSGTYPRGLQISNQQRHPLNALGAAQRALTDKVVAARVLFRKMIVAEVGSKEPGRYGGLSIYFPDPNMAVSCKTQRSASSWARRYSSTVRTKYSSFVRSVLANRKGSVCYAPLGSQGGPGDDATNSLPQQGVDTPEWFGVLCSRILKPFSHRRPDGAVGILAVVPPTVASALMFRGFAAGVPGKDDLEIIVTSTVQATMTDAEIKRQETPFAYSRVSRERLTLSGASVAVGKDETKAGDDSEDKASELREFTVVQGWWDSQVWTLRQMVRLDDPLKDPRPSAHIQSNPGDPGESEVESIVVALEDSPAASRTGAERVTRITFPFLYFKDALEAECLEDSVLHTEALGTKRFGNSSGSSLTGSLVDATMELLEAPGVQRRILKSNDLFTGGVGSTRKPERRHVLSTTVLPLSFHSVDLETTHWIDVESRKAPTSGKSEFTRELYGEEKPVASSKPSKSSSDGFKERQLRRLSASRVGTASWLLHERFGREPQRRAGGKRPCGARAYLLAEWNEKRNIVSDPVLYVVENDQATERPRAKGGLLRPIEHRLKRKLLSQQELLDLPQGPQSQQDGGYPKTERTTHQEADGRRGRRPPGEFSKHQGLIGFEKQRVTNARRLSASWGTDGAGNAFTQQQSPARLQKSTGAIVLEESLGEATFLWTLESDASKLILKPKSISQILQQRRFNIAAAEDGKQQHTERPVIGFIAQDISDQRAVAANSVTFIEENDLSASQNLWEYLGHWLGFLGSATEESVAPSASPSAPPCRPNWLGDGICDEPCDTPLYEFDRGDCPHLNNLAEDLLEQREPKGACVENRCSETAVCEAYDDEERAHPTEQAREKEPGSEPNDTPLVATIWEGPKGRYVCRCPKGYTGDGVTCEDVNECEAFAGAICHSKAVCINTKGSYRCLCKPGYAGDGRDVCMPISQKPSSPDHFCVDSNNQPLCPPSLQCLDDGSCGCREGYYMEDGMCKDIDECASGLASCASPTVATCINTRGGYFCSCVDGYEGDGRQCVASPSTADVHISIAMDYEKTLAAAGGAEMLKEVLIDAILQAIPGLADRTRIEVTSIYEGSINALIRIHPPALEAAAYAEGSDAPRQLTAAEVLLALQEQLTEPLSSLRTGPFGEYAVYATIEQYTFLDRSAANGTFDLLAFLTDWMPAWLKDAVPRELLAATEVLVILLCITVLAICSIRAAKRFSERKTETDAAGQQAEFQRVWDRPRRPRGPEVSPIGNMGNRGQLQQRVQRPQQHMSAPLYQFRPLGIKPEPRRSYQQELARSHYIVGSEQQRRSTRFPSTAPAQVGTDRVGGSPHIRLEPMDTEIVGTLAGSTIGWEPELAQHSGSNQAHGAVHSQPYETQERQNTSRVRQSSNHFLAPYEPRS